MKKRFKVLIVSLSILFIAIIGFAIDKKYTNEIINTPIGSRTGPTKLGSLSDVNITSPSAGQALIWDATTTDWINGSVSQDLSGYLSTTTASTTYAKLSGAVFTGAISATNLSGTNTGNESTSTIGTLIEGSTATTSPADTDKFAFSSTILRHITWANIKASLKTYFDPLTTTLTNKRITPRVGSLTASTTLTIDSDLYDAFYLTEVTATTTFSAPSGTPTSGQRLILGITASSTAQGLIWATSTNSFATSSDLALPSTTVANKTMYLGFIWNSVKAKWILLALLNNI